MRRYALFVILFFLSSSLKASIVYGQVHCEWSRTLSEDTLGMDTFMDMAIDSRGFVYVTGYSGSDWSWTAKCLAAKLDAEGNTIWKSFFSHGEGTDNVGQDIATDNMGNAYVTGVSNTAWVGEVFTLKYDSLGNLLWSAFQPGQQGSNPENKEFEIIADSLGNSYVCFRSRDQSQHEYFVVTKYEPEGTLRYSLILDGGIGAEGHAIVAGAGFLYAVGTVQTPNIQFDVFTVKLDADGDTLWTRHFDNPDNDWDFGTTAASDIDGNILVGGEAFTDSGGWCPLIVKYNPDGNLLWYDILPSNGFGVVLDMDTDSSSNVYVTGTINTAPRWSCDYFAAKYSSAGEQLWCQVHIDYGVWYDYHSGIRANDAGEAYVTFKAFTDSTTNAAILKYSPAGDLEWMTWYDSPGYSTDHGRKLELDGQGNIYIGGIADIDPERGDSVRSGVNDDILVAKFVEEESNTEPGERNIPNDFALLRNYPNPFNSSTVISIQGSDKSTIEVFDITGRMVASLKTENGRAVWRPDGLSSGVYFARAAVGDLKSNIIKMIYLK